MSIEKRKLDNVGSKRWITTFCFVCFPIQTYLTDGGKKQHLHSVAAVQLLYIK